MKNKTLVETVFEIIDDKKVLSDFSICHNCNSEIYNGYNCSSEFPQFIKYYPACGMEIEQKSWIIE